MCAPIHWHLASPVFLGTQPIHDSRPQAFSPQSTSAPPQPLRRHSVLLTLIINLCLMPSVPPAPAADHRRRRAAAAAATTPPYLSALQWARSTECSTKDSSQMDKVVGTRTYVHCSCVIQSKSPLAAHSDLSSCRPSSTRTDTIWLFLLVHPRLCCGVASSRSWSLE
jgi:hypothetical protein